MEESEKTRIHTYPEVDDTLIHAIESLTPEELSKREAYPFVHGILQYAVEAIAHIHFVRLAQSILDGDPIDGETKTIEELLQKFDTKFQKSRRMGVHININALQEDGIYVPTQRHSPIVPLFAGDYVNKMNDGVGIEVPSSQLELMDVSWRPIDFLNTDLLETAEQFSKDLWSICVLQYVKTRNAGKEPAKITRAADRLIDYYWKIVDADDKKHQKRTWSIYSSNINTFPEDQIAFTGKPTELPELIEKKRLRRVQELLKGNDDGAEFTLEILSARTGTRKQLVELFARIPTIMSDNF